MQRIPHSFSSPLLLRIRGNSWTAAPLQVGGEEDIGSIDNDPSNSTIYRMCTHKTLHMNTYILYDRQSIRHSYYNNIDVLLLWLSSQEVSWRLSQQSSTLDIKIWSTFLYCRVLGQHYHIMSFYIHQKFSTWVFRSGFANILQSVVE